MVADVLAQVNVERPGRILVDVGPGSFTGVRIGLAAARAFALVWVCPIGGVSADSLVARAAFARADSPDRILVLLDALRGEVFARAWSREGPLGPFTTLEPTIAALQASGIGAAAGNGCALLSSLPGWVDPRGPDARAAGLLLDMDRVSADPLYIRAPDAKPQV